MFQNGNIIMNYPMNFQSRPVDPSNQMQYAFQQAQTQRMQYQYMLNNNLSQPQIQPQIQKNSNLNQSNQINENNTNIVINQNNTLPDNQSNAESNNLNNAENSQTSFKLLTKYKDIYVPTIYLLDYNDLSKSPFNIIAANSNQIQSYNQFGQAINNNQNNNILNKYLNYGYNFEQWKKYVNDIKAKFDELNELVKNGVIRLPDPDNELEYLMAFPSDYGGLGNVQNDQNYENVKFYDPKDTSKNQANKNFMSLIKFEHDQIWFPLEPNPSSLNKQQFNDYNKIINFSPNMKYYLPQNFFRNPNVPSTIVSNQEIINGNSSNAKNENDQNKER